MSIDTLIQDDLVNFRRSLLEAFKVQHPHLFSILDRLVAGRENRVGIEVLEEGKVAGKYTLLMDGVHVIEAKSGILDSAFKHPLLGTIKPYVVVERTVIEQLVKDENFKKAIFSSLANYLPDLTIKFLR